MKCSAIAGPCSSSATRWYAATVPSASSSTPARAFATNILADRLRRLQAAGILSTEPAAEDGRSSHYRLTEKGIALAPVLLDMLIWGARYQQTAAPCSLIAQMTQNREAVLAETYRRWAERDPTPLLPPFVSRESAPKTRKSLKQKSSPKGTRKP